MFLFPKIFNRQNTKGCNITVLTIQLRYLGVLMRYDAIQGHFRLRLEPQSIGKLKTLPRSIGKLKNLQTLEVTNFTDQYSHVSWKSKNMRHFVGVKSAAVMNSRLVFSNNLRTLKAVMGGRWVEDGRLANLTNLQRLKIILSVQEELNSLVPNIERLHCLESLSLVFSSFNLTILPTAISLSHLEHLQKLSLDGEIKKLPDPHQFPPNLVKLTLKSSDLEEDSIIKLERLSNLKMLLLGYCSYKWTKLVCSSSEGFPQLHILHLQFLYDLEELIVEEGAMMKLKNLKIDSCPRLEKIPERFKLLTT